MPPLSGQNQWLQDAVTSLAMYDASATAQCSPGVTGPCNVVKQLPSCTINALWANPVGGRKVVDRAPGVIEMKASCTVHTLRPSGRAITRGVSKPTRSAISLAMNEFICPV